MQEGPVLFFGVYHFWSNTAAVSLATQVWNIFEEVSMPAGWGRLCLVKGKVNLIVSDVIR